ncbi:hypothetical protein JTE90_012202 [Oedothorax gibbosus]|uniref:Uncharacterized protein n=1 Tax=Oedothorax gibbosus TaxID=931172 RepID=A0AAV6TPY2_9ARAC|nr:hypothetical protein JTE90_012202 [Oedothorax gibbosus]
MIGRFSLARCSRLLGRLLFFKTCAIFTSGRRLFSDFWKKRKDAPVAKVPVNELSEEEVNEFLTKLPRDPAYHCTT